MNALDWILAGIAFICVTRGILRGAVAQVFGVAGLLGGLMVAAHLCEPLSRQLTAVFPGLSGTAPISFFSLFLLTWVSVGMLGHLLGRALRRTVLGFLDRLLGAGIGGLKALVFAVLLVSVLTFLLAPGNTVLAGSLLRPYVQQATQLLVKAAPEGLEKLLEEKQEELQRFWSGEKGRKREGEQKAGKGAGI